ncbi:MAG: ribonuclease III [Bacteroidales bacterium]|nr:ribonuclease III [Bacteroidales bacterium]
MFTDIWSFIKYLFRPNKQFIRQIRRITGFYPNHLEYYRTAIIHRSVSKKTETGFLINNERLEFLGDSVLDLLIGEYLYKKFPNEQEGFLTQLRSRIVNGENLTELSKHIGLDHLIKTSVKGHNNNVHLYGDAFEAFLGAVYLDRGFKKAGKYIIKRIMPKYLNIFELEHNNYNFKSQLIEWGQKNKREVTFVTDIESPGSRYFVSYIKIDGQNSGSGIGISKKEAEQKAAKVALNKVSK